MASMFGAAAQRRPDLDSSTQPIQRMHLVEKGVDIDETDNMVLKAAYFEARKDGRRIDLQAIMDAQNRLPRNEDTTIMASEIAPELVEGMMEVAKSLPKSGLSTGDEDVLAGWKVPKHVLEKLHARCLEAWLPGAEVIQAIGGAKTSNAAGRLAIEAYANGATLDNAVRLAAEADRLTELRMGAVDASEIAGMVGDGFLKVVRVTYCDTPLKSGSVYEFHLALAPKKRVNAEWHVHWASGNRVSAASFKNKERRTATGNGARVSTDKPANDTLRSAIKGVGLWGP